MNIPCPTRVDCVCTENPLANLSSEEAESDLYIGLNWGWGWNFPRLGSNWTRSSCLGLCESIISQADADLCAALNNLICLIDTWGDPPQPPDGPPGITGPPIIDWGYTGLDIFYNNAAYYTVLCPDGTPFTWGINAGVIAGPNQATADAIAMSLAREGAQRNQFCMSDIQEHACYDKNYVDTVRTTKPVRDFTIAGGQLPPGLITEQVSGSIFKISGQPTAPGVYNFTVRATMASGSYMQKTYTIDVWQITPSALPTAQYEVAYNESMSVTGGVAPYQWTIAGPPAEDPPTGLQMDANGNWTGTPTEVGDFSLEVIVTDAESNSCRQTVTLHVMGKCNTEVSDTQVCYLQPTIVASYTVPEETYCEPLSGVQEIAQAEALAALADEIGERLQTAGCNFYYRLTLGPTGRPFIQVFAPFGWSLRVYMVYTDSGFPVIPPNPINLNTGAVWDIVAVHGFISINRNVRCTCGFFDGAILHPGTAPGFDFYYTA